MAERPDRKERGSLGHQLRRLIGIRLVGMTSVALSFFVVQLYLPEQGARFGAVYRLAGLTYAATLLYVALLFWLRGRSVAQAYVQFTGDILLTAGLVYNYGGHTSPFVVLYFLVIIVATTLLPPRGGHVVAGLAWGVHAIVLLGLHLGWLPPPPTELVEAEAAVLVLPPQGPPPAPLATSSGPLPFWLIYNLAAHLVGFFAVAILTSRLARHASEVQEELQEKDQDLAALRVLHRDVVESVPSGLITCDPHGLVTSANPAALAILGLEAERVVGHPIHATGLFTKELWNRLAGAREESRGRQEVMYSRGGSERPIGFTLSRLGSTGGSRKGTIVIFQDLSDWRRLQEQLRIKDRMAAVGELSAGLAHEVGNPLAAISGSVQLLSQELPRGTRQGDLLNILLQESQRLDRTIKGFLEFARPQESRPVEFDLPALLREQLALLRNSPEMLPEHRLDVSLRPASWTLRADPDQLCQIFWNLTRNALRAMPQGGTLRIAGRLQGPCYRLAFSDSGRGMSEEERAKLFQPFRSFFDEGSGIGMSIVYRIVQEHGGRLSVDSEPGTGTTVTVELPTVPSGTESP